MSARTRAMLAVAAAATLFGTTGTARELGAPDASALGVGAARLLVGGGALLAFVLLRGTRLPRPAPLGAIALAGCLVAIYQLAFFAGLDRTGVAVGTVVTIGSGPPLAGLLAMLAGQGRPDGRWLVSTALAIVGVAILADPSTGGVAPLGIALALLSGLGYAGYTVVAKAAIGRGAPGELVVASAFALGGLLLAPALVVTGTAWLATTDGLATALYLGLVPTALAYLLFARGLVRLPAPTVTTIVLVEPVVATVLGVLVLDESLGVGAALGCALVVVALLVLAAPSRTPVRR